MTGHTAADQHIAAAPFEAVTLQLGYMDGLTNKQCATLTMHAFYIPAFITPES